MEVATLDELPAKVERHVRGAAVYAEAWPGDREIAVTWAGL